MAVRPDRVQEIFIAAVALPPDERAAYLTRMCGDDEALHREVESLLANDAPGWLQERIPWSGCALPIPLAAAENQTGAWRPEQIGRYRIVGELGCGGMGVVYRAEQDEPRRAVALKVVRPECASPEVVRRFRQEMELLGRFSHPGIAHIFDAGATGGQPYFAMELIDGTSLTDFVEKNQLDTRARLHLLAEICDAVQHAHDHGVVHRDLKPANILITKSGQPKVLDFGVARAIAGDVHGNTLHTQTGQLVGTIAYMSPEQLTGPVSAIGRSCDVYALGVILFELLAGRPPYALTGLPLAEVVEAIKDGDPPRLSTIHRIFRGDLDAIVANALEKEPLRRYGSAGELAEDVRRFLRHEPVRARRAGRWYTLQKFARRHRGLVAGTAAVFALLSLAVAGTTYGLLRAREANRELQAVHDRSTQMTTFLVSEVVENLDRLIGVGAVQRSLTQRLRVQIEALLASRPNDPQLLFDYASCLRCISGLHLADGDPLAAMQLRQEALQARQKAYQCNPAAPWIQCELAVDLILVGDMLRMLDDHEESAILYENARRIQEELVRRAPDERRFRDDLAWSYLRIGESDVRRKRFDRSEALFEQSRSLFEQLWIEYPDRITTLDGMQLVEGWLSSGANRRGDRRLFDEHAHRRVEITREMIRREPYHLQYLMTHVAALRGIAESESGRTSPGEPNKYAEEAAAIVQRMCEIDRDNLSVRAAALQLLLQPVKAQLSTDAEAAFAQFDELDIDTTWLPDALFTDALWFVDFFDLIAARAVQAGAPDRAARYCSAARDLFLGLLMRNIENPNAIYRICENLFRLPDPSQRRTDLMRAALEYGLSMRVHPNPSGWRLLGQACHESGDFDAARRALENALVDAGAVENYDVAAIEEALRFVGDPCYFGL